MDSHRLKEMVPYTHFSQKDQCRAIAFNLEQTIMIAGCSNNINVFQFLQGQLRQTQTLVAHTGIVLTLYFMKQSMKFFSGGEDEQIRIWDFNEAKSWFCLQQLKDGHNNYVNQIIMNQKEDLMISCSFDKTIKFWVNKNEWVCSQTLVIHTNCVFSIGLNGSENLLVSCAYDSQILISKLESDNIWRKRQIIKVEQRGARISFIENNIIVFQSYDGIKMDIFKLNEKSKQFIKFKEVKVENCGHCSWQFPQQFNKKLSILQNKNGNRVNLIRYINYELFIVEQSIKLQHSYLFGTITDDGEYLVTWDFKSNEIQVRKQI